MGLVKEIIVRDRKILVRNYSFCKEAEMIALADQAKEIIQQHNQPSLLLSCFNNCYATPAFMRHVEKIVSENLHYIEKQAFVGLNTPKKIILKGFNFFLNRDYQAFDTKNEAVEYLVEKKIPDVEMESF